MLYLGLGTGLGSTMIVYDMIMPMELGHLPSGGRPSRSTSVAPAARGSVRSAGARRCCETLEHLSAALQPDYVVVGGGLADELDDAARGRPRRRERARVRRRLSPLGLAPPLMCSLRSGRRLPAGCLSIAALKAQIPAPTRYGSGVARQLGQPAAAGRADRVPDRPGRVHHAEAQTPARGRRARRRARASSARARRGRRRRSPRRGSAARAATADSVTARPSGHDRRACKRDPGRPGRAEPVGDTAEPGVDHGLDRRGRHPERADRDRAEPAHRRARAARARSASRRGARGSSSARARAGSRGRGSAPTNNPQRLALGGDGSNASATTASTPQARDGGERRPDADQARRRADHRAEQRAEDGGAHRGAHRPAAMLARGGEREPGEPAGPGQGRAEALSEPGGDERP